MKLICIEVSNTMNIQLSCDKFLVFLLPQKMKKSRTMMMKSCLQIYIFVFGGEDIIMIDGPI